MREDAGMNTPANKHVVVGFDGSLHAAAALETAASLLPHARASIAHLWTPPFADEELRHRLWTKRRNLDGFIQDVEREGRWRANRIAAMGVALAEAAGWDAAPLVRRVLAGEGFELAQLVKETRPDLVVLGTRGLSGVRAAFGSVSDVVVHHSVKPILILPHPMLSTDYEALTDGPAIVGWDGSRGAQAALTAVEGLFPNRELLPACVDEHDVSDAVAETAPGSSHGPLMPLRVEKHHGSLAQAVAKGLIACTREHKAALIVVGSRGRSAAKEILLGSVAMATLHHAHQPVLVVPATE